MMTIAQRFNLLHQQIRSAEQTAKRKPHSVQLLAVSKTKPAEAIIAAYKVGQRHFGESYVQEALAKQQHLGAFNITWHFIGPIQSNKTRVIAENFHWVHSVDRLKIAQRLSQQRPAYLPPLAICLQVNISDEASKSGIALSELADLTEAVNGLPNITLRGVMAVPAPGACLDEQRRPFRTLYNATMKLEQMNLDTFSFGMSDDLQAAIMEGSTMVRIGTALFGART